MSSIPALVKEYMFHLLAQSMRILHYSEGGNGSRLPTLNPHLNPSTGLLVQLQSELRRLYEEETKGMILFIRGNNDGEVPYIGIFALNFVYFFAEFLASLKSPKLHSKNRHQYKTQIRAIYIQ